MSGRPATSDGEVALPCACANLRRAMRAVTQLYDGELRGAGLRVTQFTLLQALMAAGPIRQGDLGDILALDSTTLTRTLRPLLKQGWVRSAHGADRRVRYFELTPAGQKQLRNAQTHWERAQKRLRRKLGEAPWKELEGMLGRVTQAARGA
jgi:DNA-binding MarR family transcriptional regulator